MSQNEDKGVTSLRKQQTYCIGKTDGQMPKHTACFKQSHGVNIKSCDIKTQFMVPELMQLDQFTRPAVSPTRKSNSSIWVIFLTRRLLPLPRRLFFPGIHRHSQGVQVHPLGREKNLGAEFMGISCKCNPWEESHFYWVEEGPTCNLEVFHTVRRMLSKKGRQHFRQ